MSTPAFKAQGSTFLSLNENKFLSPEADTFFVFAPYASAPQQRSKKRQKHKQECDFDFDFNFQLLISNTVKFGLRRRS
jgi:hypothetical protein